VIDR